MLEFVERRTLMAFEIRYSSTAVAQLRQIRAFERSAIFDAVERILQVNPTVATTIKRLREPAPTQYRLRVGNHRVFDGVDGPIVAIIQIMSKADSIGYLGGKP